MKDSRGLETEHEQVEIFVIDSGMENKIEVDKGMEDIIKNCFHWNFPTNNSCIDNQGFTWICFNSFKDVSQMMQITLSNNTLVNGGGWKRDTLFHFFRENGEFSISFDENVVFSPNEEDTVIGDGSLESNISLRFPKENFLTFKKLFFEVFPYKSEL